MHLVEPENNEPERVSKTPERKAPSSKKIRLLRKRVWKRYEPVSRQWRKHVHGLIFIPAAAEKHITIANRSVPEKFQNELERLSMLGVPWACAILGYQALLLRPDGTRDIDRAISLCSGPAQKGDPYAQYILSWALRLNGDIAGAVKTLMNSTKKLFPPAILDSAYFLLQAQMSERQTKQLFFFLTTAQNVGHAGAFARRLMFYRSGRFGVTRKVLGYLLFPLAAARYLAAAVLSPFSANVFFYFQKLQATHLRIVRASAMPND